MLPYLLCFFLWPLLCLVLHSSHRHHLNVPLLDAEPQIGNIQSTPSYAAPEVLAFMAAPSWEAFDEISFWAQDAWSIGCILAWLVTGEDPFAGCDQEGDAGAILHCLLQRHAALVSQLQTTPTCYPKTNLETLNQCLLQRHATLVSQLQTTPTCHPNMHFYTLNQCLIQCHAALVINCRQN